jgi:hypothetical protein
MGNKDCFVRRDSYRTTLSLTPRARSVGPLSSTTAQAAAATHALSPLRASCLLRSLRLHGVGRCVA